jgi:hypothetical protein
VSAIPNSKLRALIDSGCTRSFIDYSVVKNSSCKLSPLSVPIELRLFDGSIAPTGPIRHFVDLDFTLPGGASDRFRFLVTQLDSSCSMALGYDWLKFRNPNVDWKRGELTFLRDSTAPSTAPILVPISSVSLPEPDEPSCLAAMAEPLRTLEALPKATPAMDIAIVSALEFAAFAYESPELVGSINLQPPSAQARSTATESVGDDTSEDLIPDHIPSCYHDFADVFSKAKADILPPHRSYDHAIDLEPGASIPYGRIYRLSEVELKALKEFLDEYLAKGFIRPSISPGGAPVLFIKKKDGSLRLCVDYRGLNNITTKDRYPLPRIDELLDRLGKAYIYTKLDLRSGYNLIRLREGDEFKTAFRTRYGSYEFLVMHFGLTNGPATFQHFMNDIFRRFLDDFLAGYLDDLIIFTATESDVAPTSSAAEDNPLHVKQVRQILQTLRDNGLFANPKKCFFHVRSVDFLGYMVSPEGLSMDPIKTQAIHNWPLPSSVKEIQSFLGFANFYRRFILGYSSIVKPLTNLTRKEVSFEMTSECVAAFERLKSAFTSAPILAHFQPELVTVVETDASDYAIAAILSQESPEDGRLHPVAYFSRSMAPAELNYEIYDKELLAIFAAFKQWRAYLEGSTYPVRVVTDHRNLEYFATTKLLTRRQARWSEFLSSFHYKVLYRPGRLGGKPDILTRRSDVYPKRGEGTFALANPQNLQQLFKDGQLVESLRATYTLCPELLPATCSVQMRATILDTDQLRLDILSALLNDHLAQGQLKELSPPWSLSSSGLLLYNHRVYVPSDKDLRLRVLQSRHDHETAGHPGFRRTLELVRREFYWPGCRDFVAEFCRTCDGCPRNKAVRHKPYGLLKQLPIPERPWESVSVDFIVQLPPSTESLTNQLYDAILVVVDRLTKLSLFIPTTSNANSADLARLYIKYVFSKRGVPSDIISDRGSTFTSDFTTSLSKLLNIKLNFSTAYHPQTDGQTERTNQQIESYLRTYTNYQQDDWADLLPIAEFAYNNAPHSATQISPFFANYGYHPRATISLDITVPDPTAHDFARPLSDLHDFCRQEIRVAQSQYQSPADRSRLPIPLELFEVGKKVWLNAKNIKTKRPSKKLDSKKLGPFVIEEQISSHAFRLTLPLGMRLLHPVFHVSLLEPYRENTIARRTSPPPLPVEVDGETEYEVAAILDSRVYRRRLQYLVEWSGYENSAEATSWEVAENLTNCPVLLAQFHARYPKKDRPPQAITDSD